MGKGKQARTEMGKALQDLIEVGEKLVEAVKRVQEVSKVERRKGEPPPEEMVK